MELPDVSTIITSLCDGDNPAPMRDFVTLDFMISLANLEEK